MVIPSCQCDISLKCHGMHESENRNRTLSWQAFYPSVPNKHTVTFPVSLGGRHRPWSWLSKSKFTSGSPRALLWQITKVKVLLKGVRVMLELCQDNPNNHHHHHHHQLITNVVATWIDHGTQRDTATDSKGCVECFSKQALETRFYSWKIIFNLATTNYDNQ